MGEYVFIPNRALPTEETTMTNLTTYAAEIDQKAHEISMQSNLEYARLASEMPTRGFPVRTGHLVAAVISVGTALAAVVGAVRI